MWLIKLFTFDISGETPFGTSRELVAPADEGLLTSWSEWFIHSMICAIGLPTVTRSPFLASNIHASFTFWNAGSILFHGARLPSAHDRTYSDTPNAISVCRCRIFGNFPPRSFGGCKLRWRKVKKCVTCGDAAVVLRPLAPTGVCASGARRTAIALFVSAFQSHTVYGFALSIAPAATSPCIHDDIDSLLQ